MKRVMLFMVLAALLLTQCKKPSIDFPTPSVTTTVSMTITAGPGSKTDITTDGGIVWSKNDKIYVGDGSKYVGFLTLVGDGGDATGTFTGDVTVTTGTYTFHFYYLGNAKDYDDEIKENGSLKAVVDFSSQDIHADGRGNLTNASKHHVGYGKAAEPVNVVAGQPITGLQVSMKSKVAIAYFRFTRVADGSDYTGALTLSGTNIYNKMTVNFSGAGFAREGTNDGITLEAGHAERYAMLVPTGSTAEETLNFGGGVTGSTTLANGIEANKFYRIDGIDPIVVEVKGSFSVDKHGNTVEFSLGNLQYLGQAEEGHKWRFAEHQWDIMGAGPSVASNRGNVDLGTAYAGKYNTGSGVAGPNETVDDKEAARDLFGWGCTGFQDTRANQYQTNYQPYSTSTSDVSGGGGINDYGYGPDYDVTNKYGLSVEHNSDWGCLAIGGDPAGTWRTLTSAEWEYLLKTRTDANRLAKAKVSGANGLLIFPDGYALPDGYTAEGGTGMAMVNGTNEAWPNVNIPKETWTSMENTGVVFLPAVGNRKGTELTVTGNSGSYWSSTCVDSKKAYSLNFGESSVMQNINFRYYGRAVRLVRE